MAESAALVPVPFYPPVRYGAGIFQQNDFTSTPRAPVEAQTEVVFSETDRFQAYGRDGEMTRNPLLGRYVDIYI
ncbi:MAG: hypothetical protein CR984_01125 [Proteobacteria bacterium]|nr:MAG: hypothetical protein CR984_01125 [Pseudomonadota bacterium]PIE66680.1 MAG: hypothetical protein CSA23_07970 [Deltaproteobacteria bacterium]